MIFSPEEIQKLYDIIDYRLARIVADVMGDKLLTPEDKSLLRRYGYKWRKEIEKIPIFPVLSVWKAERTIGTFPIGYTQF